MKILLTLSLALFLLVADVNALIINEVMPNPVNESNEWIEIYNPENITVNLSLLMVGDDYSNKSIIGGGTTNSIYFLIIGENANISEITEDNISYFRTEGKIGKGLSNSGEDVYIYNSTYILDNISYPPFQSYEGYSWCRAHNGSWFYCEFPTPGFPNVFTNTTDNQTQVNETNTTENTCDLRVWIECNDTFTLSKNKYYPMVEDLGRGDLEPEIEYWIEDMFGNIVRSKFRTTNTNTAKFWTPPEIKGTEVYFIHLLITDEICNDTNLSNNQAEKMIIVMGDEPYSDCSCKEGIIEAEKPCSCGPCPACPSAEDGEGEREDFEIISCPEEIRKDEEFEIQIEIRNPENHKRNYTVYSYVYEGNKPLSLGFDGNEWTNRWDANRQNLSVDGKSSATLELKNRIAEDTIPGEYKLRVRIWANNEKHDLTKDILIKEPLPFQKNQTREENGTKYNESESRTDIITGRIISKGEENWFSAFIEGIINFFKNLFRI